METHEKDSARKLKISDSKMCVLIILAIVFQGWMIVNECEM